MAARMFHRREVLRFGGAATAAVTMANRLEGGTTRRKKLLFLTKSAGYEHAVIRRIDGSLGHAEHALMELGRRHGFDVEATKDASIFDGDLDEYAAFAFFTTGDLTTTEGDGQPPMSPAGKQALLDAVHAGKGFVGLHCATDTFHSQGERSQNQTERDPFIDMIGGEFLTHGKQQKARIQVINPSFPGMKSSGSSFVLHEEWYSLKNFAPDLHVLLVINPEGMDGSGYRRPPFPATWARRHGKGRVFYTCMGHRQDVWAHPNFQSIVVGGIQWALGNEQADTPANIKDVTPRANVLPQAKAPS